MENQATVTTNTAPVKAAIICLVVAWIFALLPIPFLSMMGMVVMNLVAFILAIICMSKNAVKHGAGVLIGTLVGTPIMYFLGLAILGGAIGGAASSYSNYNQKVASAKAKEVPPVVAESVNSSDLAGEWSGQFTYPNGVKADFKMTLANPNGSLLSGDMSEVDPSTKQMVNSVISGNVSRGEISLKQVYSGQQEASCAGRYVDLSKQIVGQCSAGNVSASFTATKKTGWL